MSKKKYDAVLENLGKTPVKKKKLVVLNNSDCGLDFDIEGDGLQGSGLHVKGFAYCWSGARANYGVTRGRYCFGCKIVSNQQVILEDPSPDNHPHMCYIGISTLDDNVLNIGDTVHSFGYGTDGNFSNAGSSSPKGVTFKKGDTIVCAVDLDRKLARISFSKNGVFCGFEKTFEAGGDTAFFPHVLVKNVIVEMSFSHEDVIASLTDFSPWYIATYRGNFGPKDKDALNEGYKPWSSAIGDGNAVLGPTFSDPSECEVIMMVGLPASGKTTWAKKYMQNFPDKRFMLLGTSTFINQMKAPGSPKVEDYPDISLVLSSPNLLKRVNQILDDLLPRAAKLCRNYIIDRANVSKSCREPRLAPFTGFLKVAAVVFPTPEEYKSRKQKRFTEIDAGIEKSFLDNFVLPKKNTTLSDENFDKVLYTELDEEWAHNCLDDMKVFLPSEAEFLGALCEFNYNSARTVSVGQGVATNPDGPTPTDGNVRADPRP